MDTLVFDIETQNFFTDEGVGRDNFAALKISVVGAYSYEKDAYKAFGLDEIEELADWIRDASTLVGFSINRYDVPVLNLHLKTLHRPGLSLFEKERIDLLDLIEFKTGKRISLDRLAQANLGMGKTGHGSEAIALWKEGKIEELKSYCLKDVELTRQLFDFYRQNNFLWLPSKSEEGKTKLEFGSIKNVPEEKPTLF